MCKPVEVAWLETAEQLELRYRSELDAARKVRLQALWLVRRGAKVPEAAREAGVGGRSVERWLTWYRVGGLADVLRRVRGHGQVGGPSRLSGEQRRALLERAARGEFRTYNEARAWVQAEFGVDYAYSGIYGMLARKGKRPTLPLTAGPR